MSLEHFEGRGIIVPAEQLQDQDERCSLGSTERRHSLIEGVLILAALAGAFVIGGVLL